MTCGFPFCYDLGMYDYDPPEALLDSILTDLSNNYNSVLSPIDAILISGDFVMHGLSRDMDGPSNWSTIKLIIEMVTAKV